MGRGNIKCKVAILHPWCSKMSATAGAVTTHILQTSARREWKLPSGVIGLWKRWWMATGILGCYILTSDLDSEKDPKCTIQLEKRGMSGRINLLHLFIKINVKTLWVCYTWHIGIDQHLGQLSVLKSVCAWVSKCVCGWACCLGGCVCVCLGLERKGKEWKNKQWRMGETRVVAGERLLQFSEAQFNLTTVRG